MARLWYGLLEVDRKISAFCSLDRSRRLYKGDCKFVEEIERLDLRRCAWSKPDNRLLHLRIVLVVAEYSLKHATCGWRARKGRIEPANGIEACKDSTGRRTPPGAASSDLLMRLPSSYRYSR